MFVGYFFNILISSVHKEKSKGMTNGVAPVKAD